MTSKSLSFLGYPDYEITDTGEVFGPRGKVTIVRTGNGLYPSFNVSKNKKQKQFRLHVVLALAFIPNPNNLPEVHHKDSNKENWSLSNLEWVTHKENLQKTAHLIHPLRGSNHPSAKLTEQEVIQIRKEYVKGSTTYGGTALGKKYNVCPTMILKIINNKYWKNMN